MMTVREQSIKSADIYVQCQKQNRFPHKLYLTGSPFLNDCAYNTLQHVTVMYLTLLIILCMNLVTLSHPPGTGVSVSLSEAGITVMEEAGTVSLTLSLTGSHSVSLTASLTTLPGSATGETRNISLQ